MMAKEKIIDLDDDLKKEIQNAINTSYKENTDDKSIAESIRTTVTAYDQGKWNVLIGKDFGSHVVHLSKKYGFWIMGEQTIIVWKSG